MSNHKTQRSEDMTLGPVVLSYPKLFEPEPIVNGEPKYSVNIIMTPDICGQLNQAAQQLAQQAFPGGEYQLPQFQWPFSQTEHKVKQAHYAQLWPGHWVSSPKSSQKFPPQVVDSNRKPLVDRSLVFAGAKAYVVVNLYSYAEGNNVGIGIGLSAVMVWGEGDHIAEGAAVNVDKAFQGIQVTPVAQQMAPQGMPTQQPGMRPQAMPPNVTQLQPAAQPQPVAQPMQQPAAQPQPMAQTGPMGQAQFGQPEAPGSFQQPAQTAGAAQPQAFDPATGQPIQMPNFG